MEVFAGRVEAIASRLEAIALNVYILYVIIFTLLMSNSRLRVRQLPEDVVGKPNDGYLCQFNGSEIDCCVLPRNLCCEPGGIEEFSLSYHFSHGAFPATVVCGKLTS